MELWRAYRYVYKEKARKNEDKLREKIASLEQQLMGLQNKYLPSAWSCVDPMVAKIQEQNKKIDELQRDKARIYNWIQEKEDIIHGLEKQIKILEKQNDVQL